MKSRIDDARLREMLAEQGMHAAVFAGVQSPIGEQRLRYVEARIDHIVESGQLSQRSAISHWVDSAAACVKLHSEFTTR